jgi:hypothetical protein
MHIKANIVCSTILLLFSISFQFDCFIPEESGVELYGGEIVPETGYNFGKQIYFNPGVVFACSFYSQYPMEFQWSGNGHVVKQVTFKG